MTSRRDRGPTAVELAAWARVADPRSARGTVVRQTTDRPSARGWHSFGEPVVVTMPTDEPVRFTYRSPACWRIETASRLVGLSDGRQAVGSIEGVQTVGACLLVLGGPAELLHPGQPPDLADPVTGPHELLGRGCWRWDDEQTAWWVDAQSGILLRADDLGGSTALTALELDVDLDAALFALPPDIPPLPPEPVVEPFVANLTVVWWPTGCGAYLVAGDPDVPEVLLALMTDGPEEWFLGIAPPGRPAPRREDLPHRSWDGDGWAFALSHPPDIDAGDLDRVVASVPRAWA